MVEKKTTIVDVAKAANMSTATVSRYFNSPYSLSETARAKIAQAITQLNYQPDYSAKALRKGLSNIIVILTRNIHNPNYAMFFRSAEARALEEGYITMYCNLDTNAEIEKRYFEFCVRQRVAGVIGFTIFGKNDNLSLLTKNNIPVILLDSDPNGQEVLACLETNVYGAAYEGTKYLLTIGHRNIAFLNGDPESYTAQRRLSGYLDALCDYGNGAEPITVCDSFSEDSGYYHTSRLLLSNKRITAFFPANNQLTLGCFRAMREFSIDIPGKISLLGFDETGGTQYYSPPLTVAKRTDIDRVGNLGMSLLLDYLKTGIKPGSVKINYPVQMIVRASCAPPPSE